MYFPMLDLRTRTGELFSWASLWQRRNLLVLIAHEGCPSCRAVLAGWARAPETFAAENTAPVAIFDRDPGEPFPGIVVLLDPESRYARLLDAAPGTILAVDRFFEVMERDDVHELGPEAAAADAMSWVWLAERRCPECGIATW